MLKSIQTKRHNLLIPLICWIVGIIISDYSSFPNLLYYLTALLLVTSFLVKRISHYCIFLLFLLLAWSYTDYFNHHKTNELQNYISENKSIQQLVEFKVLSKKQTSIKKKTYYLVDIDNVANTNIKNAKALIYRLPDTLKLGHKYKAPISLSLISRPKNPGEFNFNQYYHRQGIDFTGYPYGLVSYKSCQTSPLEKFKYTTITKIKQLYPDNFAYAFAIFLGEKSYLDLDSDTLSKLGVLHLFAVSGLHVGIIYLILSTLLGIFLKRQIVRISTIPILLLYSYLCNWSPSVTRTVIILIIFNLTHILQRKISFLQLISITLFTITIVNPNNIFSVGLHLSLTAFISLWIADRYLLPKVAITQKRLTCLNPIISYLIYSLSVIILIAPLSALYFNQISFNAIITNILATPLITLIISIILLQLMIPSDLIISHNLTSAFDFLVESFNKLLEFFAHLPLFLSNISINPIELTTSLIAFFLIFFTFKKRFMLKILLSISFIVLFYLVFWSHFFDKTSQVIFFASGKADCSFIKFPDGQNLIIDTGSNVQSYKVVKSALLPYLIRKHINTVNNIIITHAHEDHYGGLPELIKNLQVQNIYLTDESFYTKELKEALSKISHDTEIHLVTDTLSIMDNRVKILHPDKHYHSSNPNNMSIVAKITIGDTSFLFTGDIEKDAEDYLVNNYADYLKTDFLKCPHHGSITSSSQNFLNEVRPTNVFIPTSIPNKFNLPDPDVISNFNSLNTAIWISGRNGALQLKP